MKSNNEYNALKAEIQHNIQMEYDADKTALTITIAIITLSFQQKNPFLFCIAYIPLALLQVISNRKHNGREKIAAYIQTFYPDEDKWERFVLSQKHNSENTEIPSLVKHQIIRFQTFLYAVINGFCSMLCFFQQNTPFDLQSFLILSVMNLVSCIGIFAVNRQVHNSRQLRNYYLDVAENYKRRYEQEQSSDKQA